MDLDSHANVFLRQTPPIHNDSIASRRLTYKLASDLICRDNVRNRLPLMVQAYGNEAVEHHGDL